MISKNNVIAARTYSSGLIEYLCSPPIIICVSSAEKVFQYIITTNNNENSVENIERYTYISNKEKTKKHQYKK